MARIGIQTWGSDGDIRPFLARAAGLKQRGHEVEVLCTSVDQKDYGPIAQSIGVPLTQIGQEQLRADPELMAQGYARLLASRDPIRQVRLIWEGLYLPAAAPITAAARELAQRSDLVVGHFMLHPVAAACEAAGTPHVSVTMCHAVVPSPWVSVGLLPDLGATLNGLLWRLAEPAFRWLFGREVQEVRARMGLPPARRLLRESFCSRELDLVPVSPTFWAPRPDMPAPHCVTGFWDMPDLGERRVLDRSLEEFLSEGAPPLFLGFGSLNTVEMGPAALRDSLELLVETGRLAGERAIVQGPWSRLGIVPGRHTPELFRLERAPHEALFPRCLAAVHHGGAGTTHSATRAGLPQVVAAHVADQLFWGRELKRLGFGAFMHRRHATPARLAKELRDLLESSATLSRAGDAGAELRNQDGVAIACSALQAHSARRTRAQ